MDGKLYVACENIPAGHHVVLLDPRWTSVRGHAPSLMNTEPRLKIAIGIARENLREGFRVVVRDNGVYEDDA
jgi:hypothetical protein